MASLNSDPLGLMIYQRGCLTVSIVNGSEIRNPDWWSIEI